MKKYVFLIMVLVAGPVLACQQLYDEGLNRNQIQTLQRAYFYGKGQNWGLTMAAIAWKESNAGINLINLQDPSVGPFHVTVDKVVRFLGLKDTPYNQNRAAQIAIDNFDVSAYLALKELKYWRNERERSWRNTLVSYNAGNDLSNQRGQAYAADIISKITKLKKCGW